MGWHSHTCCVIVQKAEAAGAKPEGGKEAAEIQDRSLPGMAFMMECYEGELKRPIRNLVNGRLLRTILIQVGTPQDLVLMLVYAPPQSGDHALHALLTAMHAIGTDPIHQ